MTDKERWVRDESYSDGWNDRTEILYDMISNSKTILEFGAGMCFTVNLLKADQVYTPSDLVNRDEYSGGRKTIVMDLNNDPWDIEGPYEAVMLSGVLEYIEDLPKFIKNLATITDTVVCSYANTLDMRLCEKNGWVNHYSQFELKRLFIDVGYGMMVKSSWEDQYIFKFIKER